MFIQWIHKRKKQMTFLAGILLILALLLHVAGYHDMRQVILVITTVIAGVPIFIKAFQAARMRVFSIELLVTIAVIGALIIGEYVESAVVTFLFLFGDYLEARTLQKTRSSLKELVDMVPQEATVIRGGEATTIPAEEVVENDRIIIRPGGKVPVDGKIILGHASVNESAVTGESVPAAKDTDDKVFSGTIVDNGYIEVMAEKVGDDTTFAKIIELVEEAQESKSKTQKFLDKFANVYTPAVVILAVVVYLLTFDVHLAITFLVVACPGALVIGAPVSNVAGIGNGARNGVLVKGGEVMDNFSKVDTLIFDKTGTLTKGKPEVTDIKPFNGYKENDLLQLVAEAEMISEHHLGQTIVKEAKARGLSFNREPEKSDVIKGGGLRVTLGDKEVVIGNRKLMISDGIAIPEAAGAYHLEREKAGNTAVFAAVNGVVAGIVSIADKIREDAAQSLAEMRQKGIKKIVMLTGDNKHTAALVASQLGIDEVHAELLPEDKVAHVKRLKASGHVVAMAGDGINDAPAIATADIGLAMGEGGTDISMETADVVLMADKLSQFAHAYALSKATIRNMKQNTFLAVGIVFALLGGVLGGVVHLASGMFIHEASVLLVILNGMRLIRFNRRPVKEKKGRVEVTPA